MVRFGPLTSVGVELTYGTQPSFFQSRYTAILPQHVCGALLEHLEHVFYSTIPYVINVSCVATTYYIQILYLGRQ